LVEPPGDPTRSCLEKLVFDKHDDKRRREHKKEVLPIGMEKLRGICKMSCLGIIVKGKFGSEQTVLRLVKALPELTKGIDLEEGPYSILGEFALTLRDGIDSGELSADLRKEAFRFLNDMGKIDDIEVQN